MKDYESWFSQLITSCGLYDRLSPVRNSKIPMIQLRILELERNKEKLITQYSEHELWTFESRKCGSRHLINKTVVIYIPLYFNLCDINIQSLSK